MLEGRRNVLVPGAILGALFPALSNANDRLCEVLVLLVSLPATETLSLPLLGKEMVDYICQYLSNVRQRRVTPDVQPGYMRAQLPDSAPMDPDSWDNIFGDIEKIIMPGVRNNHDRKKPLLPGVNTKSWECPGSAEHLSK